jgi:GAF domain-containing protein
MRPTDRHPDPRRLIAAFATLAEAARDDDDDQALLRSLTEGVVDLDLAAESGTLVSGGHGDLEGLACSHERTCGLEQFQLDAREGPCMDCWRSGEPLAVEDLGQQRRRWPRFAPRALAAGFRSVDAVPLIAGEMSLGALGLFHEDRGAASEDDRALARGLADVTAGVLVQQRALRAARLTAEQLRGALESRVVIEQAKGVLASQLHVTVDEAFARLRAAARHNNLRLRDVAQAVLDEATGPGGPTRGRDHGAGTRMSRGRGVSGGRGSDLSR